MPALLLKGTLLFKNTITARSLLNPKSKYLILFSCLLLIYLILNSSRIITIASILLTFDLSNLLYQSSHRPALASFNPHDYVSFWLAMVHQWHSNYIDSVYSTAKQIGQTSGLSILTPDRVTVIRPPSTIAFIFYSYGIIGLVLLFFAYYVYFKSVLHRFTVTNTSFSFSSFLTIAAGTLTLLLMPGLAFNPMNLLPPALLILLFYQLSSNTNSVN